VIERERVLFLRLLQCAQLLDRPRAARSCSSSSELSELVNLALRFHVSAQLAQLALESERRGGFRPRLPRAVITDAVCNRKKQSGWAVARAVPRRGPKPGSIGQPGSSPEAPEQNRS